MSKTAINVQYIFKEFSLTLVITLSYFNSFAGPSDRELRNTGAIWLNRNPNKQTHSFPLRSQITGNLEGGWGMGSGK